MCIGVPMQVQSVEGHQAWCLGREGRVQVNTALIGQTAPGDWLLVFLGDAREALSPERAAEVQSALDLVLGALQGADSGAEPAFDLPSQMDAAQLRALTGQCA